MRAGRHRSCCPSHAARTRMSVRTSQQQKVAPPSACLPPAAPGENGTAATALHQPTTPAASQHRAPAPLRSWSAVLQRSLSAVPQRSCSAVPQRSWSAVLQRSWSAVLHHVAAPRPRRLLATGAEGVPSACCCAPVGAPAAGGPCLSDRVLCKCELRHRCAQGQRTAPTASSSEVWNLDAHASESAQSC